MAPKYLYIKYVTYYVITHSVSTPHNNGTYYVRLDVVTVPEIHAIGLYRDVWIAAIASSRKSLATETAAICVRFHGRRVRHVYATMQITFLARKSALIYGRGLRQRVASLTIDCNGEYAIRAYIPFPPTFAIQREREKLRYWVGFFGVLSSPLKTAFGTIGNCRLRSH